MGDGFGLLHLGCLSGEGASGGPSEAGTPASGARLFGRQFGGLLFKEQLEGALGQPVSGGVGDLLERAEVDIEPGTVVAERPPGDDLGPLLGQVVELSQFIRRELVRRHPSPPPEVPTRATGGLPIPTPLPCKTHHKP